MQLILVINCCLKRFSGGAVFIINSWSFGGGWEMGLQDANTEVMDYVEISTVGNAIDFGDLKPGQQDGIA